jgi:hypothetical protein
VFLYNVRGEVVKKMEAVADKRWYDANPILRGLLEKLKITNNTKQEKIISDIKNLIMSYDSELMDRWVLEFPLTTKRRWYDKNPYSWLVINSLKYAEKKLLRRVMSYLKKELKSHIE